MGAVIVIIGVALMIIIHEGAHFAAAKGFGLKATEAFLGFGPTIVSRRRGETEYGVKAFPLGGFVRIIGMNPFEEIDPGEEARTYRAAPFWKKSIVVLAGIASHLVVAFFLFFVVALIWGMVVATTTVGRMSEELPNGDPTPASTSGIQVNDQLVSFNGDPINAWDDLDKAISVHPGETVTIGVLRNGVYIEFTSTLATKDDGGGFFGVGPLPETTEVGFLGAIGQAFTDLWTASVESIKGLWLMVVNFPKLVAAAFGGDQEVLDTSRPVSPIGLMQIAGSVQSSLMLLALVNVFVAVLNLVPLYPLDGGHFAVALYEKIRGRTPDVRKLMPVAVAVFTFVVAFGLFGIYFDITNPIRL